MKDNLLKTRQEIAQDFGISAKTLKRWIDKHQITLPNGLLCPKLQNLIKEKILLEKTNH
jgi:transposase-like protein